MTELQEFLVRVEAIVDQRIAAGCSQAEVQAAAMAQARKEFTSLYAVATRKNGVGDVHLAVISLVQGKFAALAEEAPAEPMHQAEQLPECPHEQPDDRAVEQLLLLTEPTSAPSETRNAKCSKVKGA